jgi:hypothetical protein
MWSDALRPCHRLGSAYISLPLNRIPSSEPRTHLGSPEQRPAVSNLAWRQLAGVDEEQARAGSLEHFKRQLAGSSRPRGRSERWRTSRGACHHMMS